ncbi:Hypothetical predicted protein [Pelobates cultripes]|uniref:Uncharacterized protein n=1 Tax=Pelobates cultripes TaxID=61616 RepID=A0AAD1T5B2_PELCU|nr:Hypothetical predicted protein [Pelobates cultripes]
MAPRYQVCCSGPQGLNTDRKGVRSEHSRSHDHHGKELEQESFSRRSDRSIMRSVFAAIVKGIKRPTQGKGADWVQEQLKSLMTADLSMSANLSRLNGPWQQNLSMFNGQRQ